MAMRKGFTSNKSRNNLVITSVALQDHISRSLLDKSLSSFHPVSTIRRQGLKQDGQEEREYVLDHIPRLTLAQKMGLVAGPARRLTEDEWAHVKARSVQRGDCTQPCVICKEEFHLRQQVLLSCTHVFHRACVQAFEKFSGRKCCPVCRKEQYETRVVRDGARFCRQQSATRIQAYWRGYVSRKRYRSMRKTVPPKDKRLRQKFFEAKSNSLDIPGSTQEPGPFSVYFAALLLSKLEELNDRFLQYCHTDVESTLSHIDCSLASSRRVFQQLDEALVATGTSQLDDWDGLQEQVLQRGMGDCPICLTLLYVPKHEAEAGSCRLPQRRPTVLLSCSHLFHQHCLEAFEAFCEDSRPTCPLCRSSYKKKLF